METGYVIYASYGEYDDYTELPLFFCPTKMEVDMFTEALNKKEKPYWDKVVATWKKRFEGLASAIKEEEFIEMFMPRDISFGYHEIEIMTLFRQHPAT
jgi:hypothetical protein